MVQIRRRERVASYAAGALLCALACTVAPGNAVTPQPAGEDTPPAVPAALAEPNLPRVAIGRDPFVGDAQTSRAPGRNGPDAFAPIPGIPILPPNRGALGALPVARDETVAVEAIANGPHPRALVDVGGTPVVVAPGDRIAGRIVESIDPAGIVVSGERWTLDTKVPR